jgi:hypothetical protein
MGDSSFPETTEPLPMGDDSFPSDLGSADSDPGFQYDSAPMNEPSSNVSISSGPGPSWQVITGWTTIGLGVAALSGAIATSYLALSGIDEADQLDPFAPNYLTSFESVQSDIENQALISNILYPLGGALLTTGIVLLVLDATDGPSAISTVDDNFRMDALPLRGGVLLRTSLDF